MNKFSRTARSVTFAAIVGLSLGVAGPGMVAQAEGTWIDKVNDDAGRSPLVNRDARGALTIHKKADPQNPTEQTGNFDVKAPGEDLPGVGFTVYRINNINLTTNEGLAAAAKAKVEDYIKNGKVESDKVTLVESEKIVGEAGKKPGEHLTNARGEIVYQDLALGAYLVVETSPKDGYTPAAPFIAYVPMTQNNKEQGGTEWNYNVHAYPKNYSEKKPEKKVDDSGKNVGDEITYTVTAYAQGISEKQKRTVMRIEDTLDSKLTVPSSPDKVKVAGFDAKTDYEVSVEGQKVIVKFLEAGLQKIKNGQKIEVTIPATVKEMGDGDGDVKNTAQVFENDPNTGEEKEPKETPEVHTYYGGVKFAKVEAGTDNKLPGAEFKVYGVKNKQTCDQASIKDNKLEQVKVNGEAQTYTSAEGTGLVTIDGLHVNDYANDTEGTENLYTSYCLVETKSPKGFELLARPIEFKVLKEKHGQVLNINTAGKIENLKDRTPELPMTGGAGVGILAAIGAAIIGAGAWFARRNSAES
ncbi:isopeptide-forming domain-containing fimbrial protein [Corynebacterium diphtheriae]|nr:isopeptide-forming domain-containing fimbrial protein [Corynebacterium diphtheriae]